jgi:hypothetical protein
LVKWLPEKCKLFLKVLKLFICFNTCIFSCRKIIQEIRQRKITAVTASTGMASLQLGVGATTIHHWAGIIDGRHSHQTLAELFQGDDRFAEAKKRIREAQCLIIDEISMLSSRTFDMVEFVCRHVRECDQVFGGMQVCSLSMKSYTNYY